MQGSNVKKLICYKMSLIMIPPGTKNGLMAGIEAIKKPGNLGEVCREATKWVEEVVATIKTTPDNPYKDDEEIAGAIISEMEAKKLFRSKS